MQITLAQLSSIDKVETKAKWAMVVENPAVFSVLAETTDQVPLVCTTGQVKLAGIVLLNLLVEHQVKLYYSGDIDPEGIQIADKLKQRYGSNLQLLGFDEETYEKNKSQVQLTKMRLKKLEQIQTPELQKIAKIVQREKMAAYEEKNREDLMNQIKIKCPKQKRP